MADLREQILARLDQLDAGHDDGWECAPSACVHDAVTALRAVVELHRPEPWHHGEHPSHHIICQDLDVDHPQHRCAGCSQLDEDGSGVTVGYPCGELAVIAEALQIRTDVEVSRG